MNFKLLITALFLGVIGLVTFVYNQWPDTHTHLIVCDVGQGDAILITQGFSQILIDGGRDDSVTACLNQFIPFWDRQIELVVATHPDADHVNGLTTVLHTYRIERLLIGSTKQSDDFNAFWQATQKQRENGMKILTPSLGQRIILGPWSTLIVLSSHEVNEGIEEGVSEVAETLLSATSERGNKEVRNYNDESIVLFATFRQAKILLTGDLESAGEQALLSLGMLAKTNVLKVGHHGSKTSSTEAFIAKIQPEFSIISSGKNNSYGHPHPDVIARLMMYGSHLKRTDQEGHIELVATQQSFWFE